MSPFTGTEGQSYTFYVRANSPLGIQSNNSNTFSGTVPDACAPTTYPNLSFLPDSLTFNYSDTYDEVTGLYDSLTVYFGVENDGTASTNPIAPQYRLELDSAGTPTSHATLGIMDIGTQLQGLSHTFTNVPFGNDSVTITLDSTNVINELDETDNTATLPLSTAPPDPELSMTASPSRVRSGDSATISWTTVGVFPMTCTVKGPGINVTDSNPTYSGNQSTGPVTAKSEYTFTCTEPTTLTTWSTTATVETVGTLEEV